MKKIVFLLEELSMKAALDGLLPRLVPEDVCYQCIPHEGKQDLEQSVPRKLRGWHEPGVKFVIIRDQDSAECEQVKERLVDLCRKGRRSDTLVRIACRELESWLLGDLAAIEEGTGIKNLTSSQDKRKFRDPDRLTSPSQQLKMIVPGYQKVSGARSIAPHMDLEHNRSRSFQAFVQGVLCLLDEWND